MSGTDNPNPPTNMRKSGQQKRSQVTIDTVLEAATRLLEEGSINDLTTNHIAERAGVSIGTLYHYFPNKHAILFAIAERRRTALVELLGSQLDTVDLFTRTTAIPQLIGLIVKVLGNARADRELSLWLAVHELSAHTERPHQDAIADVIAKRFQQALPHGDARSEAIAFVITRATVETLKAAALQRPELLDRDEFLEELSALITRYVSGLRDAATSEQRLVD